MTLAYLFWHRSRPGVAVADYEDALVVFHARLAEHAVPGLLGSHTVRVPATPWMPGGGYEDWYIVEDFTALGVLNAAAIDAAHQAAHDAAATMAGWGAGGLYRNVAGAIPATNARHHAWFAKPAVMSDSSAGALWQRQLVLSPAPEFCLVSRESEDVPDSLDVAVARIDA